MKNSAAGSSATTLLNTTVEGPWRKDYQLGTGVDAITGQLRASAVEPFKITPHKAQNPRYFYSLISSSSDMQSIISSSVKGSYNLEGIKVSASTSFIDELTVSELSMTLFAQISVEESEYSVAEKYKLSVTPAADFRHKYGDYFLAGYRSASSLYVMYQCRFTSTEQRSKFAAALSAEVPEVFSTEGSAAFEKVKKEHNASVTLRIVAQGTSGPIPDAPSSGWTPETVVSVLLPWFNKSQALAPLDVLLMHYSLIDPTISAEVPIAPDTFAKLNYLYGQFWQARAMFKTCPQFGLRLVNDTFNRLRTDVESHQINLPSDLPMLQRLTGETLGLQKTLDEILNRQTFYTQVLAAARTEPPADKNFNANDGVVRWSYGYQRSDLPGVSVTSITDRVSADWKIGWNEHVFSFRDSTKALVGWDLICNRTDGHNGDWHKVSSQIIGRSTGDVFVKSDYDRGYSWTIVWYMVDSILYPAGPWAAEALHGGEFVTATNRRTGDPEEIWTSERMKAATPVDRSFQPPDSPAPRSQSIRGGEGLNGQIGRTEPSHEVDAPLDGPFTSLVADPTSYPARTVGKLFFNMGGQPKVASAVVVHRSGIMTAAHCLRYKGDEATDLVFVPAYNNGNAPYGIWGIQNFFWPQGWTQGGSAAWDLGLCTVPPGKGGALGDVVGWAGIAWGSVAGAWRNTGYPGDAIPNFPFDGQAQWQSLGTQIPSPVEGAIAKLDNLTAGGSGGPWFMLDKANFVNGVFSHFNTPHQINVSPPFGDWVGAFYQHVFG
jgi:V8-like Glu-specific endopeptidase